MYKPKNAQERIQHRLKITQGHLKKITQMVGENAYCVDVIHQSQAVQKALKEIDNLILEHHLNSCVTDAIQKGDKDRSIKEVMEIFKKI